MRERYLATFSILLCISFRPVDSDGCLTTQNDVGALNIKQLQNAIDTAECQLLGNTTYKDYDAPNNTFFDYIIVGGGTAGSVMANRLTENSKWTVLLLEAGGDPTVSTEIPALFASSLRTNLDWQYMTEPQPTNCLGSVNKRCFWPRGKVLGGTGTINAMLYVRGYPGDFNGWEELGNPGWGYNDMLHYFKKSEDLRSEEVMREKDYKKYHGVGGYLSVETFKNNGTFFTKTFSNAFAELGYQSFVDVNAQHHEGFFTLQGTLRNARRCSSASAFLHNFQTRSNLKISKNSFVTKILINEDNTAYGVEFIKEGKSYIVNTAKDIILSAGAINSPQLLMLSGIGPQNHLQSFNIEVKKNLKVGHNLQDHLLMRGFVVSLDIAVPPLDTLESTFEFLIKSRGYFAGVALFSNTGFIRTSTASEPNIQFLFTGFAANSTAFLKSAMTTIGFNDDIQSSILSINKSKYTLFVMPSLIAPRSRGRIELKTKSPFDHPLIYPGYFTVEEDIKDVLEAIDVANNFVSTETMKSLNAKVERVNIPDCNQFQFQTEGYWRCIIQHMSVSVYHPAGTCRMGPAKSQDSVVDSQLRVIGIENLVVADASIMPNATRGNINAPTLAIAEKASDLVKQYWRSK